MNGLRSERIREVVRNYPALSDGDPDHDSLASMALNLDSIKRTRHLGNIEAAAVASSASIEQENHTTLLIQLPAAQTDKHQRLEDGTAELVRSSPSSNNDRRTPQPRP
ncbi:hypothetical protein KC357_g8407 [Hortaea werneckii]|nr:hypothetical protein KC357_g8407 [Hortaea werneckii]